MGVILYKMEIASNKNEKGATEARKTCKPASSYRRVREKAPHPSFCINDGWAELPGT